MIYKSIFNMQQLIYICILYVYSYLVLNNLFLQMSSFRYTYVRFPKREKKYLMKKTYIHPFLHPELFRGHMLDICLGTYRVFIKYCVFFEDSKIFRTLSFLCFPSVSVCTQTRQVELQICSRTDRVQKNSEILRKN